MFRIGAMSFWQWVGIGTIAFPLACGYAWLWLRRKVKRMRIRVRPQDSYWASRNMYGGDFK